MYEKNKKIVLISREQNSRVLVYVMANFEMKEKKNKRKNSNSHELTGKLYEDMIDHRSYIHNLSSCEIIA